MIQDPKVRERVFQSDFLSLLPGALSGNHGCQLLRRAVNIVVKNDVLKILLLFNFGGSPAQTFLQICRGVSPPLY